MIQPAFTKAELATLFHVSAKTIDRLCAARKLNFHFVGARKRFTYNDVLAYLDSHSIDHRQPQGQYRA